MSNQTILWSLAIIPWVTVFFLNKEEIKRYMPVALFAVVITAFATESGMTLKLWYVRETIYPLTKTMPYTYGLVPVVAIWVFKLTYEKFWLYMAADSVFNIVFSFILTPWLAILGIKDLNTSTLTVFLIATALAILLYGYQLWQEELLVGTEKNLFSPTLQPAAKKNLLDHKYDRDKK